MKQRLHHILYTCIVVVTLWAAPTDVRAQFDAHFNHYWTLQGYYHPAAVGLTENQLAFYGAYSMQLLGFKHAPRTMLFGVDMPFTLLKRQHAVGVSFFNEGIGLFRNQLIRGQYAYRMKLGRGRLGIGLQAGALQVSFDPTGINLGDETDDEAFPATTQKGAAVDVGVGVHYMQARWYAALSAQHLTAPRLSLGENSHLKVNPIIYLTGGYNIPTRRPLLSIQTMAQLQSDFTHTRLDVTGRLLYTYRSNTFGGGLTYSPSTSLTIDLAATIRHITVGYAYEWYTSKIGVANGSHELVMRYTVDLSLFKKSRALHKSVRIL
ncbi:MAG: PorP/SprF family type IX secretion system membrane protein [Prevotellaceae bacterium]|nr:PorP/SprF family type IX secretion system membrane protein [Prevotellaceae bacterium]